MQIPKPTEADKEFFVSLLPDHGEIEVKPMFGNLGAFVHGNMFAGLFGATVGVRLSPADQDELAATPGSGPFGPAERPMGGYLSLPAGWRAEVATAAAWVERAFTYVSAQPPKIKKPKKTVK
jgi:TfoX/Sxy family transcriptional regulator of competence genes